MELALNVAWLMIATASYALLLRLPCRSAARGHGSRQLQCMVALGCILTILFPVISLTDDLHEIQATVEDSSSSRIITKKCGVSHQLTPAFTPHQLLYVLSASATCLGWFAFVNTAFQRTVRVSTGVRSATSSRAPP